MEASCLNPGSGGRAQKSAAPAFPGSRDGAQQPPRALPVARDLAAVVWAVGVGCR